MLGPKASFYISQESMFKNIFFKFSLEDNAGVFVM